ncbi:MAG TPA: acetate--CoA ligase family protein [Streptosporangiaceae bacterium]|nr:acetate--CoA ligase family protein [Streptosporangiaceae bacterium]
MIGSATQQLSDPVAPSLLAMLEASSVALVGASPRSGSFGSRMVEEVAKSKAQPRIYPVNPNYSHIAGTKCFGSLADLPEAVDLVLLAVPDVTLEQQLTSAARCGARAAVIFGNAHEGSRGGGQRPLRQRLADIASDAGMQLCGAGCMGFVNVSYGLRAIGYTEPDPLPSGPVALVTHSGSVFSALLRARRGFGFTLAVSSGQELVTTTPAYLDYAMSQPETRVVALVLEAIRDGDGLKRSLARAAEQDVPVVLLSVGRSAGGREMVAAHSGALAGSDGSWEALARTYGIHRVADLTELADTLELFAIGRRARASNRSAQGDVTRTGIATVHDSGLERAHVADLADELGVPFAAISAETKQRLTSLLDPGLVAANPLDVWGTGADTRDLFAGCLGALADDDAVDAVSLAVDLVHELDGDDSYPFALLDAAERTGKPLAVLSNLGSAIDSEIAQQLRGHGIPVLEGTRSGLLALRHLLDHAERTESQTHANRAASEAIKPARRRRALSLLASGQAHGAPLLKLLADYGFGVPCVLPAEGEAGVLAAATTIGYPVVLKTDEAEIQHKSDVGGVLVGIANAGQLAAAYAEMAARLGPRVLVCQSVPAGVEVALGVVRDPQLGPLLIIGAGGFLVELLSDRVVAMPPVSEKQARELVEELKVSRLLAGFRGAPPADIDSVIAAVTGLSALAIEVADELEALDINPVICGPDGAIAVDALVVTHTQRLGNSPSRDLASPRRPGV